MCKSQIKRILLIQLAAVVVMLSSCRSNDSDAARMVADRIGREMIIPDDLVFSSNGNKLDIGGSDHDFFIVNYVDSGNCTECALKLPLWEHFMSRLDASEVKVALLTIVGGNQQKIISNITRKSAFNYPVAIDVDRNLKQLNGIDFNNHFSTMLLDSEKKIIAIGNPVVNPAISRLYIKRMFGDRFITVGKTSINVDLPSRNVGFINPGDTVYTSFLLSNVTDSIFRIRDIIKSCDCLTIMHPLETIYPQSSIHIDVAVTYGVEIGQIIAPTFFERDVQLVYDDKSTPLTLSINGYYNP